MKFFLAVVLTTCAIARACLNFKISGHFIRFFSKIHLVRNVVAVFVAPVFFGLLVGSVQSQTMPQNSCGDITDNDPRVEFGAACISQQVVFGGEFLPGDSGLVVGAGTGFSQFPRSGRENGFIVGIYTNQGDGITISLGASLTDVNLTGGRSSDALPTDEFTIETTTAEALDAKVTFKVGNQHYMMPIIKEAGSDTISGFTVQPFNIPVAPVDKEPPTVRILNVPSILDRLAPFRVTFEFSEDVQAFTREDVEVANALVSNFTAVDGNTFTADIHPEGQGDVTIAVAEGMAQDLAGNDNVAATPVVIGSTIVENTQQAIADFLLNRANLILSSQPDLISFAKGSNSSAGGRFGSLALNANEAFQTFAFATSKSKIEAELDRRRTALVNNQDLRDDWQTRSSHLEPGKPGAPEAGIEPEFGIDTMTTSSINPNPVQSADVIDLSGDASDRTGTWDIWTEIQGARSTTQNAESSLGVGYVGAHYFLDNQTLIGVLGQFDWAEETHSVNDSNANGFGWMVGPYIAGQVPDQPLFYEARIAYGESNNDISPFGTFTNAFDTSRWLASAKVSGAFTLNEYTISPEASISYFEETQDGYTDSLSNVIPEQTISLGEVRFGPALSRKVAVNDLTLESSLGVSGVFNFAVNDNNASQAFALGDDDLRARFDAGITLTDRGGLQVAVAGFYDGLGISDFESYGGSARLKIPLN